MLPADVLLRAPTWSVGFRTCQTPVAPTQLLLQGTRIMNRIIWLVGAVVIILFVLSYFGLR